MHWVTCVHGEHFVGSPKSFAVHVGSRRMGVAAPGMAQQPKQSQPLGTNWRQKLMHFVEIPVLFIVFAAVAGFYVFRAVRNFDGGSGLVES